MHNYHTLIKKYYKVKIKSQLKIHTTVSKIKNIAARKIFQILEINDINNKTVLI
jgi:hypothetical protein